MRLTELLENLTVTLSRAILDQDIKGISADSRLIGKDYLFVALPGGKLDGRDYIEQAVEKGAAAILLPAGSTIPQIVIEKECMVIESNQPRKDFALIASQFYQNQPDQIFAVTGTNGKTSVASFVAQLAEMTGKKSASLGTMGLHGNDIHQDGSLTTPDTVELHETLSNCKEQGIETLCLEASSHGLSQNRLDGVRIEAAAFTNLSQDHLDYHPNMDEYFQAKARLFKDLLKTGSNAIINIDDTYADQLIKQCEANGLNVVTFGHGQSDYQIKSIETSNKGQTVSLNLHGKQTTIHLSLIGEFQVMNALCAFALLGLNDDQIKLLEKLNPVDGRMEFVATTKTGAGIYVDYAHTPDGLENALKSIRPHTQNDLYVIFGCGGDRDKTKRPLMGKISSDLSDHVIITDDNPRTEDATHIRRDILNNCPNGIEIADRLEAIKQTLPRLQQGDILLIAGKGHEKTQKIGSECLPFHDPSVVQSILQQEEL